MFRHVTPPSLRFLTCTIVLMVHIEARGAAPKGSPTTAARFALEENIAAHARSPEVRWQRPCCCLDSA